MLRIFGRGLPHGADVASLAIAFLILKVKLRQFILQLIHPAGHHDLRVIKVADFRPFEDSVALEAVLGRTYTRAEERLGGRSKRGLRGRMNALSEIRLTRRRITINFR